MSGRGLSGCEVHTMALRCDSTNWRLLTVAGEDGAPSSRYALETAMTFSTMDAALLPLLCAPKEPSRSGFGSIDLRTIC